MKQTLKERNAKLEKELVEKNRELEIEAALERVRARAMAMQKSDELKELISTVFTELTKLDLVLTRCRIMIYDPISNGSTWWMANSEAPKDPIGLYVKNHQLPPYAAYIKAWKERKNKWQYVLEEKDKKNWDEFLFTQTELLHLPDFVIAGMKAPDRVYLSASFNNFGCLNLASLEPLSAEHFDILLRFAKVFELTYTRFNDLQKAEAQAREAEIQLALERVRARTMAMQKQNDLLGVLDLLVEQLLKLGVNLQVANFSNGIPRGDWDLWIEVVADGGTIFNNYVHFPRVDHPYFHHVEKNIETFKKDGTDLFKDVFSKEEKDSWQDYINTQTIYKNLTSEEIKQSMYEKPGYTWSIVILKDTWVSICRFNTIPFSDEEDALLRRFANAFGQTYTRFLDLQKAEAQSRESQIQLALERVRARTMAMQRSEELAETAKVLFEQFGLLGINPDRMSIGIINEESKKAEIWLTDQIGNKLDYEYLFSLDEPTTMSKIYKAWQSKEISIIIDLTGQDLNDWLKFVKQDVKLPIELSNIKGRRVHHAAFFSYGFMMFSIAEPASNEIMQILIRLAKVFDLTYTRFRDLQKAEAQAREATIEAALERVRGKAMSMHSSRDLADTIEVFYHEVESLSITPRRCGVGLMDKETHFAELSTMNTTELGESIEIIGKLKMEGHPVLEGVYDNWVLQKEYHPVLRGDEIKQYYQLMRPQIAYPDYPTDTAQYGYFFFFNEGGVYAWTEKELSEDELKIYRRFTSVLSLTYKRYKDLKDAEANTREAIKQASLDRVRAETASMRTTRDLEKITPLIWNELTTLRVPFIRCGVFIMDEQHKQIHSFLSTPDGKAIAAFQLPYDSAGELSKVLAHWHKNEIFKDHWDEAAFAEWTKSLVNQGAIASEEQYSTAHRPTNLDLNFLPFLQGMLYVGSEAPLSEEEIHLVQSLADAFSTAYARYEDFNKLESAKGQIEKTLVDLKQAQSQLIQSEKMASLGELTAGIAHEIQNPLNFVNNFSDVNKELLAEMKEEMDKGNAEDAKAIANDVIENEEKINHHGKRAGDIVKGMLQHSRKSTGQKEPTDINALADEYLRLSYHGLRAKDKEFNATMKTDFDNSIGKINIIPQDIGRVLLNLYNNAFYAVQQKQKEAPEQELPTFERLATLFEPTVSVTTKKSGNSILITVKDNGNGIPKNIVDKIFQPFFTTKPTGSGTGLGLSLSYDIVKAHGGEIKVESNEDEGSEFVIQLPV